MTKQMTVVEQKALTLRDHLFKPNTMAQIKDAAGGLIKPERLLRVVFSSALRNPRILECTVESIMQCAMQCAQLGLEPILGRAYLVPYNNSKQIGGRWVKQMECTLQPGYVGLIDLARRSGKVKSVFGSVVYENDHFIFQLGSERKLEHRPVLKGGAGEPYGAYAMWEMTDGGIHMDFMNLEAIYKRRAKSQAYQYAVANPQNKTAQDCPWIQWPEEMMVKTVVKHSSKMVPASIEFLEVVRMDDATDTGEKYVSPFAAALDQIPERAPEDYARDFDFLTDKQIKSDQRAAFDAYLAEVVRNDGRSELIVKAEIMSADDWDAFVQAFEEVQGGADIPNLRTQGESPQGETRRGVGNLAYNAPPDGVTLAGKRKDDNPWLREKWINLKSGDLNNNTGLWAYVVANRKALGLMPMDLFGELCDKFKLLYKRAFPYDPDGGVPGEDVDADQGADQDQGGEVKNGANGGKYGSGDPLYDAAVDDLASMSNVYPQAYEKVIAGNIPATVEDIRRAIARIEAHAEFTGE